MLIKCGQCIAPLLRHCVNKLLVGLSPDLLDDALKVDYAVGAANQCGDRMALLG